MTIVATPSCPFPDLKPFCGPDFWALPRCDGRFWFATDGKLLAWREDPDATTSDTPEGIRDTFRKIVAAHQAVQVWSVMPATMPAYSAEQGRKCDACDGKGSIEPTEACEACEGDGECPHCGQDCPECDGDGRVSTGKPAGPCQACNATGFAPPTGVRIGGLVMGWEYARRLVNARAQICIDRQCRCSFLVRINGVDAAIMPMTSFPELDAKMPEIVLTEAAPAGSP